MQQYHLPPLSRHIDHRLSLQVMPPVSIMHKQHASRIATLLPCKQKDALIPVAGGPPKQISLPAHRVASPGSLGIPPMPKLLLLPMCATMICHLSHPMWSQLLHRSNIPHAWTPPHSQVLYLHLPMMIPNPWIMHIHCARKMTAPHPCSLRDAPNMPSGGLPK